MKLFKHKLLRPTLFVAIFIVLITTVFATVRPAWAIPYAVEGAIVAGAPGAAIGGVIDVASAAGSQLAAGATASIGNVIKIIVGSLLSIYVWFIGNLLLVLIQIVVRVASYNDFVNSAVVLNGWTIVRDISNMFFIIILLAIAFGTILGYEKLDWKQRLPKLLIFAVLINFTRVIAGIVIDFGQVIMITFVNGFKDAAGGNFAELLGIKQLMELSIPNAQQAVAVAQGNVQNVAIDFIQIIGAMIGAAIFATISTIVILLLILVLIYRVVMLWIYVTLSPIAFLLGAFPQGESYYADWWKKLVSTVALGPVLAFFLWLSLLTVRQITIASNAQSNENGQASAPLSCGPSEICQSDNVLKFIVGIGMLMGGLTVAQSFANSAGEGMGGLVGWAKKSSSGFMKGVARRVTGAKYLGEAYKGFAEERKKGKPKPFVQRIGEGAAESEMRLRSIWSKSARQRLATRSAERISNQRKYYHDLGVKPEDVMSKIKSGQITDRAELAAGYSFLAENGELTEKNGFTYAQVQAAKAFFGPAGAEAMRFDQNLKKTAPSLAFDMTTAKGMEDAAMAITKGMSSLEKFSADHLKNEDLIAAIQSKVGWSKERWASEKGKMDVDQQASLMAGAAKHTQATDLMKVSAKEIGKELSLKNFVAENLSIGAAGLGTYSYVDPVTSASKTGDALKEFIQASGGEKLARIAMPSDLEDTFTAHQITASLPKMEFDKLLRALTPEKKSKLQDGLRKFVGDPVAMGLVPTTEDRRRVRERAMGAQISWEDAYEVTTSPAGLKTMGAQAKLDFEESLKGIGAPSIILNMDAATVPAVALSDIIDKLDPAQFQIAAREALQIGKQSQLDMIRKIAAEAQAAVAAGATGNAKRLEDQLKGRVFQDIGV